MTMEPETQLGLVREATQGQASVTWVGWAFGSVALVLGLVRPVHWGLLAIGAVLVAAMAVHGTWRAVDRRRHRADARQRS